MFQVPVRLAPPPICMHKGACAFKWGGEIKGRVHVCTTCECMFETFGLFFLFLNVLNSEARGELTPPGEGPKLMETLVRAAHRSVGRGSHGISPSPLDRLQHFMCLHNYSKESYMFILHMALLSGILVM